MQTPRENDRSTLHRIIYPSLLAKLEQPEDLKIEGDGRKDKRNAKKVKGMDEKTREMLKNLPHPPIELIDPPSDYGSGRRRLNTTSHKNPSCSNGKGKLAHMTQWLMRSEDIGLDQVELKPSLWQELAGVALQHYYEKQGIKLELFGEVSTNPFFQGDICCFHLDFQAKPEDDIESSPKTMFAEVFRSEKGEVRVTFCGIMDPNDPELLKGCSHCSKKKLHPPGMKFFKSDKAFGLGATR